MSWNLIFCYGNPESYIYIEVIDITIDSRTGANFARVAFPNEVCLTVTSK